MVTSTVKTYLSLFFLLLLTASFGTYAQTVGKAYQHWADTDVDWNNNILSAQKSDYFEGEVIPHVYQIAGSSNNPLVYGQSYSFTIVYNHYQSNTNAGGFAFVTTYNLFRLTPPLDGGIGTAPVLDATFSDPDNGMQGNFYTTNANITSVSGPVQTSQSGTYDKTITVTFTYTGPNDLGGHGLCEIYFGLYIAEPGVVTPTAGGTSPTKGAHFWTGGSLQTTVASSFTGALSIQLAPSAIIVGSISGLKYKDLNKNGTQDAGEPPLAGWTIYLDTDNDDVKDAGEVSTTTAADGTFSFSVTPDGDKSTLGVNDPYYVREVLQATWEQTQPAPTPTPFKTGAYTVLITAADPTETGLKFGNFQCITPVATASVGAVCEGSTSASLTYSITAGNPTYYRVDWTSALITDIPWTTPIPASPIPLTIPGTLAPGSYTGTFYVKDAYGCESAGTAITLVVNQNPAAPTVTTVNPTCSSTTGTVTITAPVNTNPGDDYRYTYTSPNNNSAVWTTSTGPFTFLAGAGYSIQVKNNNTGCVSTFTTCTADPTPVTQKSEDVKEEVAQTVDVDARIVSKGLTRVLANPNPFTDKVRFTLQSDVSGMGSLEIYNTMGQKIATVYQGYVEAGRVLNKEYNVERSFRANLIYVFRVGEQKTTGKLLNW